MKRLIWAALLASGVVVLAGAGNANRASPPRGFIFESIHAQGRTYDYSVYVPRDYTPDKAWPFIVFLHGSGESGTDGQHQMAVGIGPRVLWNPEQYPAVILFPQKPTVESEWEDHSEAVKAMMEATEAAYHIDPQRVYLTGLSQGGHGVWTINAAMPGTFAAMAPMCGYIERPDRDEKGEDRWTWDEDSPAFTRVVDAAVGVPTWVFYGEADPVVPPAQTDGAVARLRAAGSDVKLTTYPGVGHDCWDQAYGTEGLGAWLLEHRLGESKPKK